MTGPLLALLLLRRVMMGVGCIFTGGDTLRSVEGEFAVFGHQSPEGSGSHGFVHVVW